MTSAEEVKSKLDIVDVISEYIPLKPAGANFRARCPFHDEKTASFMVSRPKQIYHCFGCGEGGDVFSFVMKQEGIEFPEALRLLAEKAGVRVTFEPTQKKSERDRLLKVLEATVQYWQKVLWETEGAKEVRRYLQDERHLLPETIREWKLGFAPDSWEALVTALAKAGATSEDMSNAGVAVRKMETRGRSVYDRFRGRIMFPIADVHGRVVGATGRILPEASEEAGGKYVNTPETALYHKGSVLYGLDKAKGEIRKQNLAVIVEGNVDVLTSHQAEITNVIAVSGTALTDDQILLLRRYTDRLAFAFDTDAAGENATLKGLAIALSAGFNVSLISLPRRANGQPYKDPDECIRENPELWRTAIAKAEPVIDHYLRRAGEERDMAKLENKQAVVKTLLPIIGQLPDSIARAHYLKRLSETAQVPESSLNESLGKLKLVKATRQPAKTGVVEVKTPHQALSEQFLAAIFHDPDALSLVVAEVEPNMLAGDSAALYRDLIVAYTERTDSAPRKSSSSPNEALELFRAHLAREANASALQYFDVLSLLADKDFSDLGHAEFQREVLQVKKRLQKLHWTKRLEEIQQEMRKEERAGKNQARLDALSKEHQIANLELAKLDRA